MDRGKPKTSFGQTQTESDTSYINNVYYQKIIVNIGNVKPLNDSLNSDSLKLINPNLFHQNIQFTKLTLPRTLS